MEANLAEPGYSLQLSSPVPIGYVGTTSSIWCVWMFFAFAGVWLLVLCSLLCLSAYCNALRVFHPICLTIFVLL